MQPVYIKKRSLKANLRQHRGRFAGTCLMLIYIGLLLTGCASGPQDDATIVYATQPLTDIEQIFRQEVDRWLGTPYRFGGVSRKGIDCSGLVMQMYSKLFDIRLPRSTSKQARSGVAVSREQLQPGDLVFFRPPKRARHVGIYLGKGEFVHTSSSRGVMISHMQEKYWYNAYWQARRIL